MATTTTTTTTTTMTMAEYKNGAAIVFDGPSFPGGMYTIILRDPRGSIADKIRCDDYRMAREYRAAFAKIARSL